MSDPKNPGAGLAAINRADHRTIQQLNRSVILMPTHKQCVQQAPLTPVEYRVRKHGKVAEGPQQVKAFKEVGAQITHATGRDYLQYTVKNSRAVHRPTCLLTSSL